MGGQGEKSTKTHTCEVTGDDVLPRYPSYTYSCSRPVARDGLDRCLWHTRALWKTDLRDQLVAELGDGGLPVSYVSNCDLSGVEFPEGTELARATLTGADLRYVEMPSARLWGASLSNANLQGATLEEADFANADLDGAVLRDADLSGAGLGFTDLSGADLRAADLSDARLSDADLSGADLRGADLTGARFRGATISETQFQNVDLSGADFTDIDVSDAEFDSSFMWLTHIQDTTRCEATLEGADLFGFSSGRSNPDYYIKKGSVNTSNWLMTVNITQLFNRS